MFNAANLPKYTEYKDSLSDFLGKVPATWDLVPIRAIFEERNEKNTGPKTDHILSVTRDRGVIPYDEKGAIGNNKSEDIERYKLVYENDLVINKMNVVIGSLGLSRYFGALSQVYIVLRPKSDRFFIKYYSYLFHNEPFYKSLIRFCTGIMELRESLNKELFKQLYLPLPALEEQSLIAKFLDQKTAQIDEAIAIKEQQIKLLQERKQIIIQKAVTQGLDPNVQMKDSGVEWIGEIPEHWEVSIAKYILRKLNRPRYKNGNTVICSNHGCSKLLGDVNQGLVSLTQHDYQGVDEADLLVHGMDAWHGAIAISEHTGDCTSVVHVCDTHQNKAYIAYYLKMLAIMNVYKVISNGVRGNTSDFRSWSKFGDIQIILPPIAEQDAVVEMLDEQIQSTDHSIELFKHQIAYMKEYKSALINNAVTGKIKVTPDMVKP